MGIVHISFSKTTQPDFASNHFFVTHGDHFDAVEYAISHGFEAGELDAQDLHTTEVAIDELGTGEWLDISHYIATDD